MSKPLVLKSSHNAFTLVELLVVIGIIALLISILMPALTKVRFNAKAVACASNQRQIYLAMAMYANENHGYMPGVNAREGNWGAQYFTSYGAYPWEYSSTNNWWYGNADNLPPDVSWGVGGTILWFGVGVLIGQKYLPPSRVVACTDFTTPNSVNFSYNDAFTLTENYTLHNGDVSQMWTAQYPAVAGSYVLNSLAYYQPDAPAKGKLGGLGRKGGDYAQAAPLNGQRITAVLMCFTTGPSAINDGPAIAHASRGVNVTYRDGHVAWQSMDRQDWAYIISGEGAQGCSSENDLLGKWSSFWLWASARE